MKTIAAINLKNGEKGFERRVRFQGDDVHVIHVETGGDMDRAAEALDKWESRADVLALENLRPPFQAGPENLLARQEEKRDALGGFFSKPLSSGRRLLGTCRKWTLLAIDDDHGESVFEDAAVLFTAGMTDTATAKHLLEYTDNLRFCDPVLFCGIPKILDSLEDLYLYAQYVYPVSEKLPAKKMADKTFFLSAYNAHIVAAAIEAADIIVVPYYRFFEDLGDCGIEALDGKTVITDAVCTDRLKFLKQRGVRMIIDTIPKIADVVCGPAVVEAILTAASGSDRHALTGRDIEHTLSAINAKPRVILPFEKRAQNR